MCRDRGDDLRLVKIDAPALGRTVRIGDRGQAHTIVGVVKEMLQEDTDGERFPLVFTTLAQSPGRRWMTMVVRTAGQPVPLAALAGALAIIGLYSVLTYLVAERTREIGIRIAVGADARRVTGMVLGQGLRFTLIGIGLGTLLSIGAVRVLRTWMYEMSVYDAPTFVAVAELLCGTALLASWLPARRASRVDPVSALRAE